MKYHHDTLARVIKAAQDITDAGRFQVCIHYHGYFEPKVSIELHTTEYPEHWLAAECRNQEQLERYALELTDILEETDPKAGLWSMIQPAPVEEAVSE